MAEPLAPNPKKPTSFLDLPPELRNTIYMMVLPIDQNMETHVKNLPGKSLGVVHVEGQVGSEASAIYFGSNTFRARSFQATFKFLKYVGLERRGMIRRMELAFHRGKGCTKVAGLSRLVSVINSLHDFDVEGLNVEAVFVRLEFAGNWVPLIDIHELEIVSSHKGWEVKKTAELEETERAEAEADARRRAHRACWWCLGRHACNFCGY